MDCFYQDQHQLYISDDCIDCGACVSECPVEAIFQEQEVPARWASYIVLNLERVAALKDQGGHITQKQEPLVGATCREP